MSPRQSLIIKNDKIKTTKEEEIDIDSKQCNDLLKIYELAMNQVKDSINMLKEKINKLYGYPLIDEVDARLKTKESIIKKMNRKGFENTYRSLVDNINDIAGVRIVCPLQEDIFIIKQIIQKLPNLKVIEEKDYINNPKKSGYSAYHMIVETPLNINNEIVIIKVEIQMRTSAMNFWSNIEHKIRYKSDKKVPFFKSKKLTSYAKSLEKIQRKLIKLYRRQEYDSMYSIH